MSFKDDLRDEIEKILDYDMAVTQFYDRVPTKDDLTLGQAAAKIETAILFTDIRSSTVLTESHRRVTMAKIYNAFLNCALRIVRMYNGEVRSFNGDSLLAFFNPGKDSCSNAVNSALQLKGALVDLIRPSLLKRKYAFNVFDIGIGVSYGEVLCTKVGIRGENNNDLIWPGTATNLAAKLGNQAKNPYNILISMEVWQKIPNELKFKETPMGFLLPARKEPLWNRRTVEFGAKNISVFSPLSQSQSLWNFFW